MECGIFGKEDLLTNQLVVGACTAFNAKAVHALNRSLSIPICQVSGFIDSLPSTVTQSNFQCIRAVSCKKFEYIYGSG